MPEKDNRQKRKPQLLCVTLIEAKPNKLFTEEQRAAIRFLRFNEFAPCAECGKKKRILWTMLCAFRCGVLSGFSLEHGKTVHAPLIGVCPDHPLVPDWPHNTGAPNA